MDGSHLEISREGIWREKEGKSQRLWNCIIKQTNLMSLELSSLKGALESSSEYPQFQEKKKKHMF